MSSTPINPEVGVRYENEPKDSLGVGQDLQRLSPHTGGKSRTFPLKLVTS